MSDTEKQPEKQRIPIAISSQQMEDRYRVEASRAKAQKMGASSRILRLFDLFCLIKSLLGITGI